MKKRFNEVVMLPGDIAFSTTDAIVSRLIRKATGSDISHAMLCVAHSSIIHADSDGVHAENTQRIFFDIETNVYVKRYKYNLEPKIAKKICNHVRTLVGTEYSKLEAVKVKTGSRSAFTNKQFCSRLVAQAYAKYGIDLVKDPNFCSPQDIIESDMLVDVQNSTSIVSEEEYEWYMESVASPTVTKNATLRILSEIRKLDSSVQSLDEVNKFVLHNPMHDEYVEYLFRTSGFLEIWKLDYEGDEIWRFDIDKMEKILDAVAVRKYCSSTVASNDRNDNRFVTSLASLKMMCKQRPSRTFVTLINLYERLVRLHATRYDVAAEWIKRHPQ